MAVSPAVDRIYDYGTENEYPPNLYHFDGLAEGIDGFNSLTEAHVAQFHEQGYLVINHAFTAEEVQAALEGMLYLVSGQHPTFKGVMYEHKSQGVAVEDLSPEARQDYVRKFMWFVEYEDRLKAMSAHPKLIEAIGQIMGERPVLFQDMALLKPPKIGREKPWHQDHAYFELSLEARVVGAWIALDEATVDNGCMIIIPSSNRQGPVIHFKRRDWQICDTDVNNQGALAVPLKPGGCLLFSSLTHHGTPTNHSDRRRRAVQFHYRPASAPKTSLEERLAIFGEEGKDVTC